MIDSTNNKNHNHKYSETSGKKLFVKYMVCLRDKIVLQSELDRLAFRYEITVHGAVHFLNEFTEDQYQELKKSLSKFGMDLLDEHDSMLISRIIKTIVQVIHYSDALPKLNFSDLISDYAGEETESILKIFSDVKGISVLQFIIFQKIERAKEMLLYEDMPLSEIAELLNYKNQHYLAAQMKKVTGLTPLDFKRLKEERLKIVGQNEAILNSGVTKANI